MRRYASLRRQLLIDPHIPKDGSNSPDPVIDNPLSQNPGRISAPYFQVIFLSLSFSKGNAENCSSYLRTFESCYLDHPEETIIWVLQYEKYIHFTLTCITKYLNKTVTCHWVHADDWCGNADSMWGRFFRNAELEKMVDQDLSRLYPEHGSYFQTPGCQAMLRRILLLWSLRHPEYGYRQGKS